ncbi:ATP-binding protein [Cerasicoccus maritimus]|uniref:ATP-binding protein n=1 Tax=Cerasicoccus maritimus TaxID=490089 RepID=UPI0028525BA7|nr:SbcC/MukB-like Walker B domain-containing protein [Cerasicoccus maritimus]
MELFEDHSPLSESGIRLERLEIQNWGTFDKDIFVLDFAGQPALLIGNNATGKTTISDALLTLLVESNRNYNVSASSYGKRKGRNENSYIKGAFKEVSQEGQIQASPEYLRPQEGTLSTLLAVFRNHSNGKYFSIGQIMYMSGGDRKRCYFYREESSSIKVDLSSFKELRSIKAELKRRGFTVPDAVRAYFEKIRSWCNMRSKALDVFNQTVAVKEIENLNSFIRRYMLDAKDYEAQVQEITRHYVDLEKAYKQILRSEDHLKKLTPIENKGDQYIKASEHKLELERCEVVRNYFFKNRQELIFQEAVEEARYEIVVKDEEYAEKEKEKETLDNLILKLNLEKETKGSALKALEEDLKQQTRSLTDCKSRLREFNSALAALEIPVKPTDYNTFKDTIKTVRKLHSKAPHEFQEARNDALKCRTRLNAIREQRETEIAELRELQGSKSNIPLPLKELRELMCEALGIALNRLPFAAELIQVSKEESDWQLAIELVLNGFGKTLLIPPELHGKVVEYAERNKLRNKAGRGMLLEYEKVDPNDNLGFRSDKQSGPDSLAQKLSYNLQHEFGGWVRREVRQRFPIKCIRNTDAFKDYRGRAVTIQGQIRYDNGRIRKDDRENSRDPKNFVLGWDNKQKQDELAQSINNFSQDINRLEKVEENLNIRETYWRDVTHHGNTVLKVTLWSELDAAAFERRIAEIELDIDKFKKENTDIAELDDRISEAVCKQREISQYMRDLNTAKSKFESRMEGWRNSLLIARNAKMRLSTPKPDELKEAENKYNKSCLLKIDTILDDDNKTREMLESEIRGAEQKLNKLTEDIVAAMASFLEAFREDGFWQRLVPQIGYLKEFRKEYLRISSEGLPQHKERFRKMARDRLYNELGQLNHELRNADIEMKRRIDEISDALREIEYNQGTYTRLRYVRANFHQRDKLREYLNKSLSNKLGGERTYEEAEAFFTTIKPFIDDLSAEDGWAKTACDVRNWYDFAADELSIADGSEIRTFRSTETSSGGEKAKLAFTILVAALTYQYNLDPQNPIESRFRFVVIDEAFAKVDDIYAQYVLELFESFGFQTMVVAPLDPKSLIVVPYMDYYIMTVKSTGEDKKDRSRILTMTKELIEEKVRLAEKPVAAQ